MGDLMTLLGLIAYSDVGAISVTLLIAGLLVWAWTTARDLWRMAAALEAYAERWGAQEGRGGPRW